MNLYIRNLLLVPLLWATGSLFVAWLLEVHIGWRTLALISFVSMWGDTLDLIFEKRPLMGPKRWEK